MKTNQAIITLLLLVFVGIGGFFTGTKYQQNKLNSQFSQKTGLENGFGQGMGKNNKDDNNTVAKNRGQVKGFRQTIGEIISSDDKSITIKLNDGSSKIILISDSTIINQSVSASKTDLKVGVKIATNGDTNTDGSITSKTIEINPHIATVTPTVNQ